MRILWLSTERDQQELEILPGRATLLRPGQPGYPRQQATDHAGEALAQQLLELLSRDEFAALVVDIDSLASGVLAEAVLERLGGSCPIWICQPNITIESAVAWTRLGASQVVGTVAGIGDLMRNVNPPGDPEIDSGLIGVSSSMRLVAASIALVAARQCNVLIEGETGTGKEVVAREIHRRGNRSRGPWVAVNCGAIPDSLLEAELFGHVRGAFTGAVQARAGKFEAANHGTIFLDEIGDMPLSVQAKLLRVIQEREIERLGGNERVRLDVRLIAATNMDLAERVRLGLFRQDLYYRLNVFQISLAPLRQRPVDIPVLASHFVSRFCAREELPRKVIDPTAAERLVGHEWPGNARELENVMEMAVILSGSRSVIHASDIRLGRPSQCHGAAPPTSMIAIPEDGLDYQQALETFERTLLSQALARTHGNKTAAADLLRLKRTTLSARLQVLGSRMPRLVA